jgi:4-amino-4-deoxy-L-arabinose transferase-like glycosyltransferase
MLLFSEQLTALVVAQAILGVVTAVAVYFLARVMHLRRRTAICCAIVTGLAPSTLLFEKTLQSEALSAFVTATALLAIILAYQRSAPSWIGPGAAVIASLGVLVRSGALPLLVVVVLAPLLLNSATLKGRLIASGRLVVAAAVPLLLYGSAMAYQNYVIYRTPTIGITFFDGVSLFGLVAQRTNCDTPGQPPIIRKAVCADPVFLSQEPYRIIWDKGPVQTALRERPYPEVNAELRHLAWEAIFENPVAFASESLFRIGGLVALRDPPYWTNFEDAGVTDLLAEHFPSELDGESPPPGYMSSFNRVLHAWYGVRWLIWAGLVITGRTLGPPYHIRTAEHRFLCVDDLHDSQAALPAGGARNRGVGLADRTMDCQADGTRANRVVLLTFPAAS